MITNYEIQYRELQPGQTLRFKHNTESWLVIFKGPDMVVINRGEREIILHFNPTVINSQDPSVWVTSSPEKTPELHITTNKKSGVTHMLFGERPLCGHRWNVGVTEIDDMKDITCEHCKKLTLTNLKVAV